ncbi:hypothetical protein JXA32_09050 [Candidatus Sumerlaeota bacterium]|nr:hypothetical protein [Candidatus Sumerlaeota bacterium]
MQRQGDILIQTVSQLPHPELLSAVEPQNGRMILFEGEGEGHVHALCEDQATETHSAAEVFAADDRDNELYLRLDRPCTLIHDEHAPLALEAGLYRAMKQREYSWEPVDLRADAPAPPEPLPAGIHPPMRELAGEIAAEWDAALGVRQLSVADRLANRERARRWIDAAYRAAGLSAPRRIVWCGSPHTGAERAGQVLQREACVAGRIYGAAREMQESIARRMQCGLKRELPLGLEARAWRAACLLQQNQIMELLQPADFDADPNAVQPLPRALRQCSWNQANPGELAWLEWTAGQTQAADALLPLVALEHLCSAWWCYENTAILCDRPVRLRYDAEGRLHSPSGPAALYADESALWAWHGMRVPPRLIDAPQTITVGDLQAENLPRALRRAMIERFGAQRYLRESGGERLHADAFGELYVAPVVRDEPIVMVRVINATPEPDGAFKEHWLRVPPETQTAREAVAWTFRLDAGAYAPLWET